MTAPATPLPPTSRRGLRATELEERLVAPAGPLARLDVVDETGSTNEDLAVLVRADPDAWPDVSLLVADHQTGGRGRAGRTWTTPARTAVTGTFSMRAQQTPVHFGWYPLLAGLGAVRALRAVSGVPAALKWPNDVLLPAHDELDGWGAWRKVGGILSEVVSVGAGLGFGLSGTDTPPPVGSAVLIGIGINVLQTADELPVPSATSLLEATGREIAREDVLAALVDGLASVLAEWRAAGNDPLASALPAEVAAACATIGSRVCVELPGGTRVQGLAERLGTDGSLVVVDEAGQAHVVLAGDVRHVRTGR
ncbi:biotin--[acetyl-CoA-carboxylase] ligase [Cellulomonas alba]|uniref:Biotin--[acetyl-CoA-carboxylase] ligase n=1 Tax=Cellulomonas alba TaxID=3053467 RepID=A0ABT7SHR1_9CELL|nr:biotin--[acetyl-CoA-carboxylase] ligase [Cellulomonas alba]MDM7855728.1 biotin--[acetyl-CoA-carboxylase] ligase [Cellulomonas alba]